MHVGLCLSKRKKHSRLAASITEPNTPEIPTGNSALKKEAPSAKLWSSRHYCSTYPCTHKGVRKHFNNVCFNAVCRAAVYGAAWYWAKKHTRAFMHTPYKKHTQKHNQSCISARLVCPLACFNQEGCVRYLQLSSIRPHPVMGLTTMMNMEMAMPTMMMTTTMMSLLLLPAAAANLRQDAASPETLLAVNRIYAGAAIAGEREPVLAWTGKWPGHGPSTPKAPNSSITGSEHAAVTSTTWFFFAASVAMFFPHRRVSGSCVHSIEATGPQRQRTRKATKAKQCTRFKERQMKHDRQCSYHCDSPCVGFAAVCFY